MTDPIAARLRPDGRLLVRPDGAWTASAAAAAMELAQSGEADVDRLRLLDDELRQDIPGTAGWRNDPAEFHDDTFGDSAFDPRTYLVAVEATTGEYIGLVRVWMNPGRPRVGMIGVRRAFRRRGIASVLLARALAAVDSDGVTVVSTEFDTSNSASRILFERLGAREVAARIELTGSPSGGPGQDSIRR